ncbi:hypothetical protein SAMN05216315_102125 [Nitrosospira sp. Nsp18]|nr:hypothetical protein SAMN05216315_102125 [Nitrosospira sp. Nsp18]
MNQIGETRKVAYINRFDRHSDSLDLRMLQDVTSSSCNDMSLQVVYEQPNGSSRWNL